jgi:hypothetical protein
MAGTGKSEIITFKADPALAEALRGIPNRSAFIRAALTATLSGVCPLCRGSGRLTADQHRHWQAFTDTHSVEECAQCHALHLVCGVEEGEEDAAHR